MRIPIRNRGLWKLDAHIRGPFWRQSCCLLYLMELTRYLAPHLQLSICMDGLFLESQLEAASHTGELIGCAWYWWSNSHHFWITGIPCGIHEIQRIVWTGLCGPDATNNFSPVVPFMVYMLYYCFYFLGVSTLWPYPTTCPSLNSKIWGHSHQLPYTLYHVQGIMLKDTRCPVQYLNKYIRTEQFIIFSFFTDLSYLNMWNDWGKNALHYIFDVIMSRTMLILDMYIYLILNTLVFLRWMFNMSLAVHIPKVS